MVDCLPISQISRMAASEHGRTEVEEQPCVSPSGEIHLKQSMNDITKVAGLNLTAWLGRRSKLFLSSLAILGLIFASCIRYISPSGLLLYVLPISFATWFLSTWVGCAFVVAASGILVVFDLINSQSNVLVWDTILNLAFFSAVVFIFSEVRALYDREQKLSLQDSLTGLLNRRAFLDKVTTENRRLQRHPGSLTLVYIDLDDFKQVNDARGHRAGDTLLRSLAQMMTNTVRSTDFVARLGGDEFAILLPDTNAEVAKTVLAKIQERLLQQLRDQNYLVTFSIGAVTFAQMQPDPAGMIYRADEAMYAVKQRGKNGIEYWVRE